MEEMPTRLDDEIDLIDYLRVIWKWKYLILVGTVVCVLIAAGISINTPEVYRVTMILQPRIVINHDGDTKYLDSPTDIKALVEAGTYDQEIIARIKNPTIKTIPTSFNFKVYLPVNTSLIRITYETVRAEEGIIILNQLIKSLSEERIEKVDYFQNKYATEISEKKAEVLRLQDELSLSEIDIGNINKRLEELRAEIKSLESNNSTLLKHRDRFLNNGDESSDLTKFLYSTTIQQYSILRNQIKNQILDYNLKKERAKSNIEYIKMTRDILSKKVDDLREMIDGMKTVQVIQPPTSSPDSMKSNTKIHVLLAAVVGVIFMLFLAFFLEYLLKSKAAKRQQKENNSQEL